MTDAVARAPASRALQPWRSPLVKPSPITTLWMAALVLEHDLRL